MTGATLLVELLTEELPPKALPKLGQAFANGIAAACSHAHPSGTGMAQRASTVTCCA